MKGRDGCVGCWLLISLFAWCLMLNVLMVVSVLIVADVLADYVNVYVVNVNINVFVRW